MPTVNERAGLNDSVRYSPGRRSWEESGSGRALGCCCSPPAPPPQALTARVIRATVANQMMRLIVSHLISHVTGETYPSIGVGASLKCSIFYNFLCELPRMPKRRSSQNSYSPNSGEWASRPSPFIVGSFGLVTLRATQLEEGGADGWQRRTSMGSSRAGSSRP